jgi:hypothetical protein
VKQLQQAAQLPVGVVINPRGLRIDTPLPSVPQLRWAGQVLAARALQFQARGDHGGALEALVAVLALSRNMKNRTVYVVYLAGQAVEQTALLALDHWLKGLGNQPKLLRHALDELARHETLTPPVSECVKAEYFIYFGGGDLPAGLIQFLSNTNPHVHALVRRRAELLTEAWLLPWERERVRRICQMVMAMQLPPQAALELNHFPGPPAPGQVWDSRIEPIELGKLRRFRLKVAAAFFQLEEGKPPQSQQDLVPRYLPEVLLDPVTRFMLPLPEREAGPENLPGGPGGPE